MTSPDQQENGKRHSIAKLIVYVFGVFALLHLFLFVGVIDEYPKNIKTYPWVGIEEPIGHVLYAQKTLTEPGKHLVILGSSSPLRAFPPEEMSTLLPGYRVHSLAIKGLSIANCDEIIDILTKALPKEKRKDVTFVVTLFYSAFVGSRNSTWQIEDPMASVPMLLKKPALDLMAYGMVLRAKWFYLYSSLTGKDPKAASEAWAHRRNERKLTEKHKQKLLEKIIPSSPPEEYFEGAFPLLLNMAQKAKDNGIDLVIVNMPLAQWVYDTVPHNTYFQEELARIRPELEEKGLQFIDLHGLSETDLFFDWAHVRPKNAPFFCKQLVSALKQGPFVD